jgi:hypothetical protein
MGETRNINYNALPLPSRYTVEPKTSLVAPMYPVAKLMATRYLLAPEVLILKASCGFAGGKGLRRPSFDDEI